MIQLLSAVNSAVLMPRKSDADGFNEAADLMSGTASPSGSTSEEFDFRIDDDNDTDDSDVSPLDTHDVDNKAALLSTKEDALPVLVEPEEVDDGYPRFMQEDTLRIANDVQLLEVDAGNDTCLLDVQPQTGADEVAHPPPNILPSQLASDPRTKLAPQGVPSSCLVHSPEASRKSRLLRLQRKLGKTIAESNAPAALGVQFSTVTIRDFPRTIGDNPASSAGLSVSLDWKYEKECTLPLDEYEDRRVPRRNGREMIMPPQLREAILREAGFSRAEIVRALRDLNVIRGQRRRTYETLHLQPFQALTEKLSRKVLNLVTLGEFKRKERNFINQHRTPAQSVEHLLIDSGSKQESFPIATQDVKSSSDSASPSNYV